MTNLPNAELLSKTKIGRTLLKTQQPTQQKPQPPKPTSTIISKKKKHAPTKPSKHVSTSKSQAFASSPIGRTLLISTKPSSQEQAIQEKMKHAPSVLTDKGKREWAERQLEKEKTTTKATETTINYSSIKSMINKNINDLKNTAEKLATMPSNQVVEINGKPVPVFLARAVVGKNLQDLEKAKNDIEYYRSQGYRIKKTSTGFIFYKTPEDIKKEHYEEIMADYSKLSEPEKAARAVSSSILFGFANPNFWSGLVTGGVKEARYAIAEEEYKWIKQNREKMRKGGAPEIVKTWAGTYFLSYPMENIVYPMAIGTGASYALGAASAVAPAAASAAGKGMAVVGYGMLGYASADIAYSSFLGKYREALTKTFGYGMQFSSAYAGAKGLGGKTPYERGFEYGRKYWVEKHPSTTINVYSAVPVKEGYLVEGKFTSASRPSVRTFSSAKGRFRGIIKNDGTFQLEKISGNIDTYKLKKVGNMLQKGEKISSSPIRGTVSSSLAKEIEINIIGGKFSLENIRIFHGQENVSPHFKFNVAVRNGLRKFRFSLIKDMPKGKSIFRNISFGRVGKARFFGKSYTVSSAKETPRGLRYSVGRTRGRIYTQKGMTDLINDYSLSVDATQANIKEAYSEFIKSFGKTYSGEGTIKNFSDSVASDFHKFVSMQSKGGNILQGRGTPAKGAEGRIYKPPVSEAMAGGISETGNLQLQIGQRISSTINSQIAGAVSAYSSQIAGGMIGIRPAPIFVIQPHISTSIQKERHFVTLPSFRTEMGQMKKTLSMSMQEYVQNIGNKIRTETIPKSEVKIEERQQEAGKTIQQSKVRGETTQYLVPIIPTPIPPVTFGFRLFPPLPVLGNLRKSRQETQKGILGYFNELQAAMSVMYGGGYKQKVKKAKNYKRRKKR